MIVSSIYEFDPLEAALFRAGRDTVYPSTPRLSARVRTRLVAAPVERSRRQRRHAWSLAFVIVLALALLLAIPETRNAIAQWLGLRTIQIIPVTPTAVPTLSATAPSRPTAVPSPTPRAQCCQTTLAAAQVRLRFPLLLPPGQAPSRVYLQELFNDGQQLVLLFGDPMAPTFTLYQAHRFLYQKVVNYGKSVGPGTIIAETKVHDLRTLWLTGEPHILVTLDAHGEPVPDSERVVDANTLAWEDPLQDLTYRLETRLSQQEAVRFAESLQYAR